MGVKPVVTLCEGDGVRVVHWLRVVVCVVVLGVACCDALVSCDDESLDESDGDFVCDRDAPTEGVSDGVAPCEGVRA